MNDISLLRALLAGILSFISPCVLPLILPYVALLIVLFSALPDDWGRHKSSMLISLPFVLGFLAIFVATSAQSTIAEYSRYTRLAGSSLLVALGISSFIRTVKTVFVQKGGDLPYADIAIYPVAFFVGVGVASGWTPCIGPTLGNILISTSTQGTALSGMSMLITYAVGLGIPFVLVAAAAQFLLIPLKRNRAILSAVGIVSGTCLVAIGYILATDGLRQLTKLFPDVVSY